MCASASSRSFDEAVKFAARHERVVDADAELAALERLDADQVSDRAGVDVTRREQRRVLPAEFERERHEVAGGGYRDLTSDLRPAGVEQVVPRQGRKDAGELELANRDCDALRVERRRDELREHLGGRRSVLGRLEDRPVAGREDLDERTELQVEREVPRRHDADDPLGLVAHLRGAGAIQHRVDGPGIRRRPGFEVLDRVGGAGRNPEHL